MPKEFQGFRGHSTKLVTFQLQLGAVSPEPQKAFRIRKGEGAITQLPAEFLIGPDLTIERAYYGKDIGDHLPIPEIDAWLEAN